MSTGLPLNFISIVSIVRATKVTSSTEESESWLHNVNVWVWCLWHVFCSVNYEVLNYRGRQMVGADNHYHIN